MKINRKFHKTKQGIIKRNPQRFKINDVFNEDGDFIGEIDITFSSKKTPWMKGKYILPNGNTLKFEGYWEEGSFQITKLNPKKAITENALIDLNQEINDKYIGVYTEEVW